MNNILLFELYNPNLELKNNLQNYLSQYPYLSYTLKDSDNFVIIEFNKNINTNYGISLLDPFEKEVIQKYPLQVKIKAMKNIDNFQEFNGKKIIQNVEKIDLPDLGIKGLKSKIDSGASCSSIGVCKMKIDTKNKAVSFIPLDDNCEQFKNKWITLPIFSEITVQSSNGNETKRPLIKTTIIIKDKRLEGYVSLSLERGGMDFAFLIGKDILTGNFLIQPGL